MLGNNIGYTSTITLKADLAGSLNLINKQGFLKGFRKTKIVFVPVPSGPFVIPVPVVVTLRVVPKYVLNASTSQSLSREAVITSSRSVDLGISYLNNNWQTTYGINGTTSVSASGITAKVSAEINASITPQISVSIYGLGGPYASVGLISQAKGNINAGNDFLWDYEVGAFIRSEVGANARVLGKTVLNTSKSWQTDPIYYRTPDTMQIASGNNQEGAGDTYLTEPVKVKVLNNRGAPQSNVQVNFTVTSGSGSVESASGLTDASGVASTRWKLGANTTTEQKLQAYAQKANGAYLASPVDFTANFTQPYSVSATAGDYQLGAANQNLANPLEVLVKDINGNPMPNIKVEWSILKGAGIITNAITYTNATGKTTNTWKLGATGEQLVKVIVQKASGVNVAGSPLLFSADLPGMTVVAGGNNRGTALNQLNRPEGIYVDANENLYIADTYNNRLVKWDKGSSAGVVQVQQQGIPISIGTIKGVYVHADSLYFLTTSSGSGVYRIKLGAADWANVNTWHRYFVGETVADFTMDSDGWIYAPDQFDHTVRKYKGGNPYFGSGSNGSVVTVAGGSGSGSAANQLNQPWDVWLDSAGNAYITDALNYRIQKWAPGSTTGVTVAGGNGIGSNANQFISLTACADNNGNVYVADRYNSRILKFAPGVTNGVVIAGGTTGSGLNQLRDPYDIFLRGRYLYICDWDNDRVMRMRY